MNRKKMIAGTVSVFSVMALAVIGMTSGKSPLLYAFADSNNGRDVNNTITLDSNTLTGAGAEFGNGSFDVETNVHNSVGFEFKYGKASDGNLISLGKTLNDNPDETNFYIGNTDPITSVTGINVTFANNTTLFFFASYDNVTYYKLDVLTASQTVTVGNGYFYFRFVNANCDNSDAVITSIVYNYTCSESDYSDELSDLTSAQRINAQPLAQTAVTEDTSVYHDDFNSRKSLRITAPINDTIDDSDHMYLWSFSLKLPKVYTVAQIKSMTLTFDHNSLNTTSGTFGGSEKTYWRLCIYLSANGTSQIKNSNNKSVEAKSSDVHVGSDWRTETIHFDSASYINDLDENMEIQYLFLRPAYVNGYINIDQMRVTLNHSYPSYQVPEAWKYTNNNLTVTAADNVKDTNANVTATDVSTAHGDGVRITATGGNVAQYTRFASIVLDKSFNFEMSKTVAGTLSFYLNYAGVTCTDASLTKFVIMQLCQSGTSESKRATAEVRTEVAAVTLDKTDIENKWVKVTYHFDKLEPLTSTTFDRLNFKTVGTSYFTLNQGEYFEFVGFSYTNLVKPA